MPKSHVTTNATKLEKLAYQFQDEWRVSASWTHQKLSWQLPPRSLKTYHELPHRNPLLFHLKIVCERDTLVWDCHQKTMREHHHTDGCDVLYEQSLGYTMTPYSCNALVQLKIYTKTSSFNINIIFMFNHIACIIMCYNHYS